jgi:hypothetical protein
VRGPPTKREVSVVVVAWVPMGKYALPGTVHADALLQMSSMLCDLVRPLKSSYNHENCCLKGTLAQTLGACNEVASSHSWVHTSSNGGRRSQSPGQH